MPCPAWLSRTEGRLECWWKAAKVSTMPLPLPLPLLCCFAALLLRPPAPTYPSPFAVCVRPDVIRNVVAYVGMVCQMERRGRPTARPHWQLVIGASASLG